MFPNITYREAILSDCKKLSVLFQQVYIQTYGTEGVSDEFANFIFKQFSIERLENTIQNNPGNIIVAVYKNNLIGVAEIEFEKSSPAGNIIAPELSKLYILEWFCGKGVGYHLLSAVEQTVRIKGIKQIWLWVLDSNTRAISFYKRQQYETIGMAPFQMETNRYENYIMVKELA